MRGFLTSNPILLTDRGAARGVPATGQPEALPALNEAVDRDIRGAVQDADEHPLLPGFAALQAELYAEALAASASRLLVGTLSIGRVCILIDIHISEGSRHVPFAIDTHRRGSASWLTLPISLSMMIPWNAHLPGKEVSRLL